MMKFPINRFFRRFATVVTVLWATAFSVTAQATTAGMLMPSAAQALPEGLEYVNSAGEKQSLAAHRGKVVVLHFWAKWCPPCIEELPQMVQALATLDAGEELVILPLSLDREAATVAQFYTAQRITSLRVLLDARGAVMRALHIKGLPATVILNRAGEEVARRNGVVDWSSEAVTGLIADTLEAGE